MELDAQRRKFLVAKTVFWIGTIGDGLIAIEWFMISLGVAGLPALPSFFVGDGRDYRFAMGVAALFMTAWTALLYWGSRKPLERRGLLLLTGVFLLIAILFELFGYFFVFDNLMSGTRLAWGTVVKLYLVVQFGVAYWYSRPN